MRARTTGPIFALLLALVCPAAARAQATPAAQASVPLAPRFWVSAGGGFAAVRAGCPTCDEAGVYQTTQSVIVDAGVRANARVDASIELVWVSIKVVGNDPIRTTFVLGVAQLRPWVDHGLFVRAGAGIAIAGNGLYSPLGPPLAPPFTTNALGIAYGTGWLFQGRRHWTIQLHATHYVAALGELTTVSGSPIKNVVGNYWIVGAALIVR